MASSRTSSRHPRDCHLERYHGRSDRAGSRCGEEAEIVERSDGTWLVDGQYNFYDFLEYFDMEDLYAEHDYNTLSGLILEILERVPKTGEKLSWLNFEFEIVDMDGARIDKVLVSKIPQKE